VLIDPAAAGVTITPERNLAGLALCSVELRGVAVDRDDIVGAVGDGGPLLASALARGAVLRAAEIAGAGERMLDLAVDYAQQRTQFGVAVGSFQAVQYLCTDVAIDAHLAGLLARRAAWLLDTGQPSARAVASAKLHASRAAAHMAQAAHEVFAGLAYMTEHDLHLLTRHAKHGEFDFGDARHHAEQLAAAVAAEYGGGG